MCHKLKQTQVEENCIQSSFFLPLLFSLIACWRQAAVAAFQPAPVIKCLKCLENNTASGYFLSPFSIHFYFLSFFVRRMVVKQVQCPSSFFFISLQDRQVFFSFYLGRKGSKICFTHIVNLLHKCITCIFMDLSAQIFSQGSASMRF